MSAILIAIRLFFGGIFCLSNIRKWFGFLVTNWKQVVIGSFIALFAYVMFSPVQFLFGLGTVPAQKAKVVELSHQVALVQAQLDTCKATNTGLAGALTDQNNHIKGWADLSAKLDASTTTLIQEISKSRTQSKSDVQRILSAPTPKTCQDALTFMTDAVKSGELSWKKGTP